MKKLEAIGMIKYNGKYKSPGTPFECDDKEAERLISLGQATDKIDPEMLKIAAEKLKEAQAEKAELQKKLKEAIKVNDENRKKILKLQDKIDKTRDVEKKDKLQKELDSAKLKNLDVDNLNKELAEKSKEIENYSV